MRSVKELKFEAAQLNNADNKEKELRICKLKLMAEKYYLEYKDLIIQDIENKIKVSMANGKKYMYFSIQELVEKFCSENNIINDYDTGYYERSWFIDELENIIIRDFERMGYRFQYVKSYGYWHIYMFWNRISYIYYTIISLLDDYKKPVSILGAAILTCICLFIAWPI